MLSACAGDSPTNVDTLASDAPVAYAKGGNGNGKGPGNGNGAGNAKTAPGNGDQFETYEDRFVHRRFYDDGGEQVLRECHLNVWEDQDGTDWFNTNVGKTHMSDLNGFLMVVERRGGVWAPTHVGRATWNFQRFSFESVDENGFPIREEISWNSRSQGVVGPIDEVLDAAFIDEVARNTDANDISNLPFDLRNSPLFEGGVGEPMISAILGRADMEGTLEGATCDVQVHFPGFGGFLDIQHHEILVGGGFPGKFKKWIP